MHEASEVFISIEGFDFFVRNAMLKHPVPNTTHTHTCIHMQIDTQMGGGEERGGISINDVKGMNTRHISCMLWTQHHIGQRTKRETCLPDYYPPLHH